MHLLVRVKVSLNCSDVFSDIGKTCPLIGESCGTLSAFPHCTCYEKANWSLDNSKKTSQLLHYHSHITSAGLVMAGEGVAVCGGLQWLGV